MARPAGVPATVDPRDILGRSLRHAKTMSNAHATVPVWVLEEALEALNALNTAYHPPLGQAPGPHGYKKPGY